MLKISAIAISNFASLLLGYLKKSSQYLQRISFVDLIVHISGKVFSNIMCFKKCYIDPITKKENMGLIFLSIVLDAGNSCTVSKGIKKKKKKNWPTVIIIALKICSIFDYCFYFTPAVFILCSSENALAACTSPSSRPVNNIFQLPGVIRTQRQC